MATATSGISMAEYLHTSYEPDVEYIGGELREKSMGQLDHERLIFLLLQLFEQVLAGKGYWATQNTRMVTKETSEEAQVRLPDVALCAPGQRRTQVLREPPLLIVEVVSPSDRLPDFSERIRDYYSMGVGAVWILDPYRRVGYVAAGPDVSTWEIRQVLQLSEEGFELDLRALFAQMPPSEPE